MARKNLSVVPRTPLRKMDGRAVADVLDAISNGANERELIAAKGYTWTAFYELLKTNDALPIFYEARAAAAYLKLDAMQDVLDKCDNGTYSPSQAKIMLQGIKDQAALLERGLERHNKHLAKQAETDNRTPTINLNLIIERANEQLKVIGSS